MDTLVYTADISALESPAVFERLLGKVPEYRREKAMRFKFPSGRAQSLGVGLLLRSLPEPTIMLFSARTVNPPFAMRRRCILICRIPRRV